MKQQQRPKSTIRPVTIIAVMLFGLLIFMIFAIMSPGRPGEFTYYAGPILPLSTKSGGEELTAERHVTMDFYAYGDPELDEYNGHVAVTDTYFLTNPTAEDVTVEMVWGFEGQFTDPGVQIPTITADGIPVDGTMWASTDREEVVRNSASFDQYQTALTENDFLAEAMAPTPQWDVSVKVYHFYDLAYKGEPVAGAPCLDVSYKLDKSTAVWARDYGATGFADGRYHLKCYVDKGEFWIYVVGADLLEMEVCGSRGINVTIDAVHSEELEGVNYQLETWDSTFMACLEECVEAYSIEPRSGLDQRFDLVTKEMLLDGAMKQIVGSSYENPTSSIRSMDTVLGNVYSNIRMLYWVFPVEIPAGATVTVSGQYEQEGSRNFDAVRHGYDLATTLGSNLNFVKQTALLVNTQYITIADGGEGQNFGFDPANGVTEVELNLDIERYFLDISLTQ